MAVKDEARIFIGGLSYDTDERRLERAFSRFGKVVETQVVMNRETGHPRGFGFVTFDEPRAVEAAIREMNQAELDGRNIYVSKAEPRPSSDDRHNSTGGYYTSSGRGYRGADDAPHQQFGSDECFKCGRPGHWARDCPLAGEGRVSPPRYIAVGHRDLYDSRYDGGRYSVRGGRADGRDERYSDGRDRHFADRFSSGGDRYPADRYEGFQDRYAQNGYGKERGYERDAARSIGRNFKDGVRGSAYERDGQQAGGIKRYGTTRGPARFEGSYRERPAPYSRPGRGGRAYGNRY